MKTRVWLLVVAVLLALVFTPVAQAAGQKSHLPDPIVSRALDAVLLPIDKAVRKQFRLGKNASGVYVLAVKPRGVAAKYGIRAGDVLGSVGKHKVSKPRDIDYLVWSAINAAADKFVFHVDRGSTKVVVNTNITINDYSQHIDYTEINNWSSVDDQDWPDFVSDFGESLENSIGDSAPDGMDTLDPLPELPTFADTTPPVPEDPGTLPEEPEPQVDGIPEMPEGPWEESDIPGADLNDTDYAAAEARPPTFVCADGTVVEFEALCPLDEAPEAEDSESL
jgi:hypothetical protein